MNRSSRCSFGTKRLTVCGQSMPIKHRVQSEVEGRPCRSTTSAELLPKSSPSIRLLDLVKCPPEVSKKSQRVAMKLKEDEERGDEENENEGSTVSSCSF